IAAAYREAYSVDAATVHNTFVLPETAPDFRRADPSRLRVYWFSQTIGPGRGIEDAIEALGRADVPAELTLRGRPQPGYLASLSEARAPTAPSTRLVHELPGAPDAMIDVARGHDVGLALEQSTPRNRWLCVPNKPFTYILAGLAVAMSDTDGMRRLGQDL